MSADPVRDEAERLVAAAIAAVSVAARGLSGGAGRPAFATGSPECCVCPVCRVIAAMREPSPELSERLATGAGDLAAGVTSLLRAFAPPTGDADQTGNQAQPFLDDRDTWRTATSAEPPPAPGKPMAKKAVKKVAKKAVKKAARAAPPPAEQ